MKQKSVFLYIFSSPLVFFPWSLKFNRWIVSAARGDVKKCFWLKNVFIKIFWWIIGRLGEALKRGRWQVIMAKGFTYKVKEVERQVHTSALLMKVDAVCVGQTVNRVADRRWLGQEASETTGGTMDYLDGQTTVRTCWSHTCCNILSDNTRATIRWGHNNEYESDFPCFDNRKSDRVKKLYLTCISFEFIVEDEPSNTN